MQISSRFTIATHMLIVLALEGKKQKLTSDILAGSVGVNPVIIRKTLSQLKNAGMITVARGTGGAEIAKDLKDISLSQQPKKKLKNNLLPSEQIVFLG